MVGVQVGVDASPLLEAASDEKEIPLKDLPPLPARRTAYWLQNCLGLCIGGSLLVLYNCAAAFITTHASPLSSLAVLGANFLTPLTRLASLVSVCCTLQLHLSEAGLVRRSEKTCYPMPKEVKRRLLAGESLADLQNITEGGPAWAHSYCVRCLVWRGQGPHHCSVCQRCVEGFDHHCRLLGRCIAQGNMVSFLVVFVLILLGLVNVVFALCAALPARSAASAVAFVLACAVSAVYMCIVGCVVTCSAIFGKS